MRSKIVIVIAFMLGICSLANAQNERTFESMGYDDVSITGIQGSLSYFLKIKPDDDVNNSKLVLHIRASQVLNPRTSFLIVYLKDEEVSTQPIIASAVDTMFTVVVPLSRKFLQPDARFIKVKIGAKMSVGDEYCKDVDNPACWIVVKNTSYIAPSYQTNAIYKRSLKEWIQEYKSVYTPATGDLNDLTAGGLIYTLLKQGGLKNIYTGTYQPQDTLPSGIVCGLPDKLPYSVKQAIPSLSQGQGLIALARINVGTESKTVLVVTGADAAGYTKAINVLASNKRLSSAFTEKMILQEATASNVSVDNPSPLIMTLDDIGANAALMEGIGALQQKYTFSLTEFNAIPSKLTFHLESYFSVLKPDDRGFLNIYLNENLIYNASLADRPSFIDDIDLKPYLLSKFNTLLVEFRFHPGTNICKDGFSNFFAFVNTKTSTLTFSGERENKFISFFNFPAEFRRTPTKVIISPRLFNSNVVSSVGEIFYQLNAPIKTDFNKLIVPQLVSSEKANIDELRGFNLIALLSRGDKFVSNFSQMPIKFDKDFQIYKDSKGLLTYNINDFSNSGLAQIFRERGSTVLLVTALGDSLQKEAFESVVKNFSTQITEIESNVCFANSGGYSKYFFKMPEDSNSVLYKGEKNAWLEFWSTYKLWILGILIILLILGFYFVRGKVKKSQEIV